jgi:poly-beta-1,6-N-acetyl-D-glucosamine synthase
MITLTAFMLVWGVWLITPVLVDGVDALVRLGIVLFSGKARRERRAGSRPMEERIPDEELPTVSIIVPAHNEAEVIDRCLNSIKVQDYPHDKLEVIVVDDGSTDETAERVADHINGNGNGNGKAKSPDGTISYGNGNGTVHIDGQPIQVGEFRGFLTLITNGHQGKAHALNAGLAASHGYLIVNIDSDVVLATDAIREMARAFMDDPHLGAATGNIEIDWDILEARDKDGYLLLDEQGNIQRRELGPLQKLVVRCQFLEYLASFRLARQSQSDTRTMYTLAGACSVFRRTTLDNGCRYCNRSVSEDTDLTLDLHEKDVKIGYLSRMKVFLEPVVEWDDLYAQRVRWTRGQLEVCGLHEDMVGSRRHGHLGRFALPQMLVLDHTLAFPRLIWFPLFLCFPMFGYPWRVIWMAILTMYVFYFALELVNTSVCYSIVDPSARRRVEQAGLATLLFMPLYRFVVFHFRFSGFLVTLKEKQTWSVPGPVGRFRKGTLRMRLRAIQLAGLAWIGFSWTMRLLRTAVLPLLVAAILLLRNMRRS